jgi:hypothetical protein
MGEKRARFEDGRRGWSMDYDIGADESVSTAVVRAVSAVEGRDPLSLRPLADVLDPDALDVVFDSRTNGGTPSDVRFTFVYSKCCVTIENGEYLTLDPIDPRIHRARSPEVVEGATR